MADENQANVAAGLPRDRPPPVRLPGDRPTGNQRGHQPHQRAGNRAMGVSQAGMFNKIRLIECMLDPEVRSLIARHHHQHSREMLDQTLRGMIQQDMFHRIAELFNSATVFECRPLEEYGEPFRAVQALPQPQPSRRITSTEVVIWFRHFRRQLLRIDCDRRIATGGCDGDRNSAVKSFTSAYYRRSHEGHAYAYAYIVLADNDMLPSFIDRIDA